MKRGFGSDNHSGIHPEIFKSLGEVNHDHAPSYGTDEATIAAIEKFKEHFGAKAEVNFVFNGTAANVLSLRALTKSYQSVFCTDVSHVNVDECAAPEFMAQTKLIALPSRHGKFQIDQLDKHFIRRGDQHYAQTTVLTLTQPTELGTLYSLAELRNLADWAKSRKLLIHMDGSRIANAAFKLNIGFREFTTDLGVDIVSFGGTKNGLMMGEAVVSLNPEVAPGLKYMRKQMAQLPSKSRFIAAQFSAYFKNDLWKDIAKHSCSMATELAALVSEIPKVEVTQKVESNAVFARIPKEWLKPLREQSFFYVWDENTYECRWMTSWDTQKQDLINFVNKMKELS